MRTLPRRRNHGLAGGQSLVEFALVCPIALTLVLGILSGSWLFFQHEAVSDGARSGARAAAIATSLTDPRTGQPCESGSPIRIAAAVSRAAPQLPVNPGLLCAVGGSTTHLQQAPVTGTASITVDAVPSASAPGNSLLTPKEVTVTVTYAAQGLAPPLTRTFTFSSSSLQPIIQP
jgi:Flp pilus assembly protein TadG